MMADVKSLEHPTLKVPYEILNKKFRTAQKNIDREVSHVQGSTTELEQCLQENVTVGAVAKALDGVVEKLSILKRKAEESIGDELDAAQVCKKRIEHLKDCEHLPPAAITQWKKKRLDRMLVEYFLRAGYYTTAIKLAKHSGIEDLTNIDIFLVSKDVEESLKRHETAKCLAWWYDNKSKLKKMKSTLDFNLRQQEFIELIRVNRRMDAVKHARKYFDSSNPHENQLKDVQRENQLKDIQRVMGLLAFSCDTEVSPYKELLDPKRWTDLVEQFRQENFKLYQLNNHSVFTVTLQAGLSALKTPQCYKDDPTNKNAECPVCSKHLNELGKRLPYAHCAQSRLICYISGESLNENNPPMMLPNGQVYGFNSLTGMAAANEGKVVCPRSKEIYSIDEAEKVFVM